MAQEEIKYTRQLIKVGLRVDDLEEFTILYDKKTSKQSADNVAYSYANKDRDSFSSAWYEVLRVAKK